MTAKTEGTRTIYIEKYKKGWQVLEIPATARVTFGPLIPGAGVPGATGLYLRIYKTSNHQLAVIPNVLQFRD